MSDFDVASARTAGYTDDDILAHLTSTRKFDVDGALKSGYSKPDIIAHLASGPPEAALSARSSANQDPSGIVSRALSGAGHALSGLNPIPAVQEFINRPSETQKAAAGLRAGMDIKSARVKPGTPEYAAAQSKLDTGASANIGSPNPPLIPQGSEPIVNAGMMAQRGDLAGAAGYLGGTAAILGAGAALPKASGPLSTSARKQYGRALSPTKEWAKTLSPELTEGLIQRRVAPGSLESLRDTAEANAQHYGQQIGAKWQELGEQTTPYQEVNIRPANVPPPPPASSIASVNPSPSPYPATVGVPPPLAGPRISVRGLTPIVERGATVAKPLSLQAKPILDQIAEYKNSFVVDGTVFNDAAYAAASRMEAKLASMIDNGEIPVTKARQVRQILDDAVAQKKGFIMTENQQPLMAAQRESANAIRSEMAKAHPDLDAINKQFSFWKDVRDVVGETLKRRQGQEPPLGQSLMRAGGRVAGATGGAIAGALGGGHIGMGPMAGAGAGLAAGLFAGEAAAQFNAIVRSPGWRMVSAVQKARAADLLAQGNTQAAIAVMSVAAASHPGVPPPYQP